MSRKKILYPYEVKIGHTNNIKSRLSRLNREYHARGLDIVLTHAYSTPSHDGHRDERLAHEHFRAARVPGLGELFRTTPESVRDYFAQVVEPRYKLENGLS